MFAMGVVMLQIHAWSPLFVLGWITAASVSAEPIEVAAYEKDCWKLEYSPDGKRFVTLPNNEGAMKLWDAATGKLIWEVEKTGKNALAFSPDGKTIAVGSWRKVHLYEAGTGKHQREIASAGENSVSCIAFSPDGSKFALVTGESNMVEVFEFDSGKKILSLTAPMDKPEKGTGGISRVAFSPDGETLVASCGGKGWPDYVGKDSVIAVWDVKTWKLRKSFTASTHNVNDLVISPDGKLIAASCHRGREVKIWKMPLPPEEERIAPEVIAELVKQLDADAFGKREAAERKLREIGLPAREQLLKALDGVSAEAAFRARKILAGMKEEDDSRLHLIKIGSDFQTVAFSPDGRFLATGSLSGNKHSVQIWKMGPELALQGSLNERGSWIVRFSPDGKQLAQGTPGGAILLYDVKDVLPD